MPLSKNPSELTAGGLEQWTNVLNKDAAIILDLMLLTASRKVNVNQVSSGMMIFVVG